MIFSKNFFFNRNINSENPGLLNFIFWIIKFSIFVTFISLFIAINTDFKEIYLILILLILEEHGRIVFITNSVNIKNSSLKFALYISIFETISFIFSQNSELNNIELIDILQDIKFRIPSIISHFVISILAYNLIEYFKDRKNYIWFVFLICVILHAFYNGYIAPYFYVPL